MSKTPSNTPEKTNKGPVQHTVALLILPLVALLAVLPLIWNGCSCGHDFSFHIVSWMEAATQFRHGNLHPHWAFSPAFNAGEPRFVFYPPLSWTIGALLGLVLPWTATPIVYTWLAFLAAGASCYHLVREFALPDTALVVAVLYAVNPYMLFTAYERTAYAELLAAAWIPLLLHGILRRKVAIPRIAIPVALLWLTNAPAAVIGSYSLALLATVRLFLTLRQPKKAQPSPAKLTANTLAGTALGMGLAGFYIVPAAYERRYVQIAMAVTDGMRSADNFLFHHTPDLDHDAVLHTVSLLAVGLLILTAICLSIAFTRTRSSKVLNRTLAALAVLAATIAFLLTPLSGVIWNRAPELPFLQFPWRFLVMLTPILSCALALALNQIHLTRAFAICASTFVAAALTFAGYHAFRQSCAPGETVAANVILYHTFAGTDPTDEYTPATADNDALGRSNPPFWLSANTAAPPSPHAAAGPLRWPLDLASPASQVLILNLRDYPAWHVTLNHKLITTRLQRDDGLIAIPVPAGQSHLDLTYASTTDQTTGWAISGASLATLLLSFRRQTRDGHRQPR